MTKNLDKASLLVLFLYLLLSSCISHPRISDENAGYISKQENISIYSSDQIISSIEFAKNSNKHYLTFADAGDSLIRTSELAQQNEAVAAINGGFFNMKEGGSVTYFELLGRVISKTSSELKERTKETYFLNGAIVVDRKNQIVIEAAREDQYYATSNQEKAVLVTGPILLLNGERQELKNITFVIKRHPRTCLCIKDDSYILLTIDGRSEDADGMDLLELSDYLLSLECRDAINLDGGGSTTLWLKEEGVYNHPSDKTGERPVSNALVIMKKK